MNHVAEVIAALTPRTPLAAPPTYTVGLDLGQAQDYTALGIVETHLDGDTRSHQLRHLHRFPLRTGYPEIVDAVAELIRRPHLTTPGTMLVVDATGVGRPVVDLLFRAHLGVGIVPVTITGGNAVTRDDYGLHIPKRELVSALQIMLQSGELQIAQELELASTLTQELAGFRVKISANGHDSYGAGDDWRSAAHDDLVLAVALACWQAARPRARPAIL